MLHRLTLVYLLLLPLARLAHADAATEAKLRDALRATTTQLRTLEDEKARWQRTESELRAELQTLRSQPVPEAKRPDKALAAANRRAGELAEANAKLRSSLATCEAGTKATTAAPAVSDEERTKLGAEVTGLKERLASSEEKNLEMYRVSKELLAWMEKVGVGGEPFFGWKRVELENLAQEYADRLLEAKVKQQ